MIISWINKFSTIDYPGELSCIVFTPGCNFRCKFCYNPEFVLPEMIEKIKQSFIPKKAFFNFLEKRKNLLSWVSICGWEATLQVWLYDFCKKLKEMWFKVKLDTNWRDSNILKKLVEDNLVDYIAMDIKQEIWKFSEVACVSLDEEKYLESLNFIKNSWVDYEFRTTVVKWIHTKENIGNIAKYLYPAKNYFLQNFKDFWEVLDKSFRPESFSQKELMELKFEAEKYLENVGVRE